MNPLVSIIVPNYNHKAYLPKRLQSIKDQTFKDYELLLLDDASTDGSAAYLKKFQAENPHSRFIPNGKNSGSPFKQWNKGVAEAKGQYVWIAESDDYAEPNLLEELVTLLQKHPTVGIAYGQSYLVNEKDEILNSYAENLQFIYQTNTWESDFVEHGPEACRKWLLKHNPIPNASGILIRKEAYEKVGGAQTNMNLNGDWFLYARILCEYDLGFTAEHLNYFRVHTQTQRAKARKNAWVYTELITINEYLKTKVPNSKREAEEAISEVGNWWIGNLPYHSLTAENWKLDRWLYRYFNQYKNNLPWRIFLTFIISYTRDFLVFVKLLKPLKRLRSWLFPGKYWDK